MDLSKCVVVNIGMHFARGAVSLNGKPFSLRVNSEPVPSSIVVGSNGVPTCRSAQDREFGSYVRAFTLLLGRHYWHYQQLQLDDSVFGCPVEEQDDMPVFCMNGVSLSPVTATSLVIKPIVGLAQKRMETIDSVVLVVPDGFDSHQKRAAMESVASAGYKCPFLLPESLAAVMDSIDFSLSTPQYFLVYDFGGESFKTSLVRFENGVLQRLHYRQLTSISGSHLDEILLNRVLSERPDLCSDDLSEKERKRLNSRLLDACRVAKEDSDGDGAIDIDLDVVDVGDSVYLEYEDVKSMFKEDVSRTLTVMDEIIQKEYHRIDTDKITKVIMVGGTSLFPVVRETVQNRFPGRVESKDELDRIVYGGLHYLMMREELNPRISLAMGRKIGLGINNKMVRTLFYEDDVPPRKTIFTIRIRESDNAAFRSALYEIPETSSEKLYDIGKCHLIGFLEYRLKKRSKSNLYKATFQLKDINTVIFALTDADTDESLISPQNLVIWYVCCMR